MNLKVQNPHPTLSLGERVKYLDSRPTLARGQALRGNDEDRGRE
jgi:hypothetical protein